jgi:hypothetical protein
MIISSLNNSSAAATDQTVFAAEMAQPEILDVQAAVNFERFFSRTGSVPYLLASQIFDTGFWWPFNPP